MANIIAGCGSYLPSRVIKNSEMVQILEGTTSEEWIVSRTGISQRHVVSPGEFTSHMAISASIKAIDDAGIDKSEIDLIIFCTTTPDSTFPSAAAKLQNGLELSGAAPSFDVQAVCSGFVYGMHIADCMMKASDYKMALVVGSETMSSILDWKDRSTSILFGDGAGAVIIKKDDSKTGIIGSIIHSDGSLGDILQTDGGTSTGKAGIVKMNGREVFRHATQKLHDISIELLEKYNIKLSDIDHFIPHQANVRIIDYVAEKLGIDDSKVVKTVDKHANCSAASIPLALAELKKSGKLKKGDLILTAAIGAGITWGGNLFRW